MKTTVLITTSLFAASLLVSCKSSFQDFTPAYLLPDSPSDAPGVGASRKMERDKRQKQGLYKVGDVLPVTGGKAMLFMSNPDYDTHIKPDGKLITAKTAKVIFCEGLYYFIETDKKDRGYIRESDLTSNIPALPDAQLDLQGIISAPTELSVGDYSTLPGGDSSELFPEGGFLMNGASPQATATTETGRVVNIKTRDTGKSDDFEKVLQSLGQTNTNPAPTATPTPSAGDDSDIPDLPEPSGSAGN